MTTQIVFECKLCRKKVADWNVEAHLLHFHGIKPSSLIHRDFADGASGQARAAARRASQVKNLQNMSPRERVLLAKREQEARRTMQAAVNQKRFRFFGQ